MSFVETLSNLRKRSYDKGGTHPPPEQQVSRDSRQENRRPSKEGEISRRPNTEQPKPTEQHYEAPVCKGKTGSKVMAAVAAFNGITQGSANPKRVTEDISTRLNPSAINEAFEKLLVCIPALYYHLRLTTLGFEEHTAECARQDEVARYEDQGGFYRKGNIHLKLNI